MEFIILKNEFDEGHVNWERACEKMQISYRVVDLTLSDWLERIKISISDSHSGFLACPPGRQALLKELYDERIYIINRILGKFVYPSYDEISIHENKRYLSYWLSANDIPHPETKVFYSKREAEEYIRKANMPLVGKMNIGASGKGVEIFRNKRDIKEYLNIAFSRGIRQDWGPNFKMGGFLPRILEILKNPSKIRKRIKVYNMLYNELQRNFVIFQEYVEHDYEWRIVKIGDSFFGHQKVKQGDKASGTKGIDYISPPVILLDYVKTLCEKHRFNSMAVDLFEDGRGGYLVNELQCIFGHVQSYICEKEGTPGRFVNKNGVWAFEEGMFNLNLSYDLRLANALSILNSSSDL